MSTFTLHGIFLSGPTYKLALMLSLCGQDFAYRHVDIRAGGHKNPDFLALNRYGQVPVLEHGRDKLVQSGAALQYLAETLGSFEGSDEEIRQKAREWLFWDADKLSPGIYRSRLILKGLFQAEPAVAAHYRVMGEQALAQLAESLASHEFVAGDEPTIADIACWGVIAFAGEAGFDLSGYGPILAWAERMAALPGFKMPQDLLPQENRG